MSCRLLVVGVITSLSLFAADAFACTQSTKSFVMEVVPSAGAIGVPVDVPIAIDWITVVGEAPSHSSAYPSIIGEVQRDALSITVHPAEDTSEVIAGQLAFEEGRARFVFDEALSSETRYLGEVSFGDEERAIALDFTTGSGALADVAFPDAYDGVVAAVLTERPYPLESCCPVEFPGQCGFERDCVQTGWGYDDVVQVDIRILSDDRLGTSAYRYELYRHESVDEDSLSELVRVFNAGTNRDELASLRFDYRPTDGAPCFRAVAVFVTGELLDSANIVCVDADELVEIPRLDDPVGGELECSLIEADVPNSMAGQEPEPGDESEPGTDRDIPVPTDSMDGYDGDVGGDEAVDDSSCAVAGPSPGGAPGGVLLAALLLGIRRSRRLL